MLLEAETNKYCPGGYDFGAISNLITWVLNFFLSANRQYKSTSKKNKATVTNGDLMCEYYCNKSASRIVENLGM